MLSTAKQSGSKRARQTTEKVERPFTAKERIRIKALMDKKATACDIAAVLGRSVKDVRLVMREINDDGSGASVSASAYAVGEPLLSSGGSSIGYTSASTTPSTAAAVVDEASSAAEKALRMTKTRGTSAKVAVTKGRQAVKGVQFGITDDMRLVDLMTKARAAKQQTDWTALSEKFGGHFTATSLQHRFKTTLEPLMLRSRANGMSDSAMQTHVAKELRNQPQAYYGSAVASTTSSVAHTVTMDRRLKDVSEGNELSDNLNNMLHTVTRSAQQDSSSLFTPRGMPFSQVATSDDAHQVRTADERCAKIGAAPPTPDSPIPEPKLALFHPQWESSEAISSPVTSDNVDEDVQRRVFGTISDRRRKIRPAVRVPEVQAPPPLPMPTSATQPAEEEVDVEGLLRSLVERELHRESSVLPSYGERFNVNGLEDAERNVLVSTKSIPTTSGMEGNAPSSLPHQDFVQAQIALNTHTLANHNVGDCGCSDHLYNPTSEQQEALSMTLARGGSAAFLMAWTNLELSAVNVNNPMWTSVVEPPRCVLRNIVPRVVAMAPLPCIYNQWFGTGVHSPQAAGSNGGQCPITALSSYLRSALTIGNNSRAHDDAATPLDPHVGCHRFGENFCTL